MLSHCARCQKDVEVEHDRPGLRKVARFYTLLPILLLPLYPIAACDYVVCIPLMMLYMFGFGPVLAILREPPTCPECDAFVDVKSRAAVPW